MGLEVIIGIVCLAAIAAITSYCTQLRNEEDRQENEDARTALEIENIKTEKTGADGSTVITTTQRIFIDDHEKKENAESQTTSETGRQNEVAATLAAGVSAGIASGAPGLPLGSTLSNSVYTTPTNVTKAEESAKEPSNNLKLLDLLSSATEALEDGDLSAQEMQKITAIAISGDSSVDSSVPGEA